MSGHTPSQQIWLEVIDSLEVERHILMSAEMTPGSNRALFISRKGTERDCCTLYRQHKPRSERICHFSGLKDKKHYKSPCLSACLRFCFKNRGKMEQREQAADSPADGTEGKLRELALKWFMETQVHLIVHNGFFPTWFLGFIARKDAEEILKEKEVGCFLIRLSDKAIGYILSYKGRDRCRHFVINQSESGQFIVCGDTEAHATVSNLIEYYKTSPIEPFGEYLTSSCFEAPNEDLYDTIQVSPKEKPVATVRAVKHVPKKQINTQQPPTRPPKSTRTVEEVPPLPRRSRHLENGFLNDQDRVLYAQLRKQLPRETTRDQHICQDDLPADNPERGQRCTIQDQNMSRCGSPSGSNSIYSELELLDSRSKSLPLLASSCDGEHSHRLSVPPETPPRLSPRPIRQADSHGPVSEKAADSCSRPTSSHSLDYLNDSAIYHLAGRPGSPHAPFTVAHSPAEQQCDSVYAEVPAEAIVVDHFANDSTYEQIPRHRDTARPKPNGNTYEPLDDIRPKHNHSSWGLKNDKWKWLFPDAKRKW